MNTITPNTIQYSVAIQGQSRKNDKKVSGFGPALLGGIGSLGTKLILPTPASIIIFNKMQKLGNYLSQQLSIICKISKFYRQTNKRSSI